MILWHLDNRTLDLVLHQAKSNLILCSYLITSCFNLSHWQSRSRAPSYRQRTQRMQKILTVYQWSLNQSIRANIVKSLSANFAHRNSIWHTVSIIAVNVQKLYALIVRSRGDYRKQTQRSTPVVSNAIFWSPTVTQTLLLKRSLLQGKNSLRKSIDFWWRLRKAAKCWHRKKTNANENSKTK